jgi:hypothetical protein
MDVANFGLYDATALVCHACAAAAKAANSWTGSTDGIYWRVTK